MVITLLVALLLFCVFSCVLVDSQSPGFTFSFETENGVKRAFVYGSPNFHGVYMYNTNDGTRRVVHFGGSERDSGPFVQLGGPATPRPVGPPTPWYPPTPAPVRAPEYAPAPRPIYAPAPAPSYTYAPGTRYAPAPGPAPAPSPAGPPLPVARPAVAIYGGYGGGYSEGAGAGGGGGGAGSQSIAPGLIASATGGGLG